MKCLPILVLALFLAGCDWDDDDIDHNPPEGQGALIVDNNTASDIRVFINGERRGTSGEFDNSPFDLEPGVYRVVLDEKNGDGDFSGEIDIVAGQLTVLDVTFDNDFFDFSSDFDVEVFFKNP